MSAQLRVSGINLTNTLTNQQVDDLDTARAQHQVLFLRDQKRRGRGLA
jgi:alpha-ketoglutarate-dependent taurine dioxygenase